MVTDLFSYELFRNNMKSLKETSYGNGVYMTQSPFQVVCFDSAKEGYAVSRGLLKGSGCSVDAICQIGEHIIFIEFKNGKLKNVGESIRLKICDSLLIFLDIIKENISFSRTGVEFVLVYNASLNAPIAPLAKSLSKYAHSKFYQFGFRNYKGLYFNDVHSYSEAEFKKYLEDNNIPTVSP